MKALFRTFVVHLTVPIDIGFSDHLVHFLVCELLTEVCHDMTQFCSADVAISILDGGIKSVYVTQFIQYHRIWHTILL